MRCSIRPLMLLIVPVVLVLPACEKEPASAPAPGPDAAPQAAPAAAASNAADEYRALAGAFPAPLLDELRNNEAAAPTALLTQSAAQVQRLIDATKLKKCDFGVNVEAEGLNAMMPHLGQMRNLARVLRADARRCAAAGDLDGAAQRTAALFRFANHVGRSGNFSIEWLVGSAIATMGAEVVRGHPDLAKAARKTDVQQAIMACTPADPLGVRAVLAHERALYVRSLREGKVPDSSSLGGRNWPTVPQAERESLAVKLDALFAQAIADWDRPDFAARYQPSEAKAKAEGLADLVPVLDKLRDAANRLKNDLLQAQSALSK